ncbi:MULTISPECIES: hypothetical protein [Bartonella]|uniref:hypothetical protein n=1 Tax=Bartonella TaxID=773 RepID=UPI0018DCB8F1|nr:MULTISPECIES: hypothetical protein [Bartonella]MBH9974175.1 hypothetical protein [Bartonella choladocola]MBI0013782.1 hypothetical protein [Bartonella sp. B10834G3]
MKTGLYKRLENKFSDKIRYLIKETPSFLKDNYLFLCLLITFIWLIYIFYPGSIVHDTFFIFSDAYHNRISNWHSALLGRFWQIILYFTENRGIFVIIQLIPLFIGMYIICKNITKGIITGVICSSLFLVVTPIFSYIIIVLKDTYLASFTFFVSALMLDAAISGKKKTFCFYLLTGIILVFCFYLRANGCFIAAPLLVAIWMGWKSPIIYRYITCFILVLCIVATASFVDIKLLKARDETPDFSLMVFDLAGIAKNTGHPTFPDIPGVPDQMAVINQCYTPIMWDTVSHWRRDSICGSIAVHYFDKIFEGQEALKEARTELRRAWGSAIVHHPLAYLKHRISHFNRFMDYQGHRPVIRPLYTTNIGYVNYLDKNDTLTLPVSAPNIWVDYIMNREPSLGKELWFHPYVSLLILLFFYLSTLATSDRFNRTLNVVSFAGLIYLVGFLFVGVASDFRYSYPSLMISILCILAAFGYYSQKRQLFGTKTTRIIAASITVPLFLIGIIL